MPGTVGSSGLSISSITASLKGMWARSAFNMGSGQELLGQDELHISGSASPQGEGVAVCKFKEVLFGVTREGFCSHMGYHIPPGIMLHCFVP